MSILLHVIRRAQLYSDREILGVSTKIAAAESLVYGTETISAHVSKPIRKPESVSAVPEASIAGSSGAPTSEDEWLRVRSRSD